MKSRAEIRVQMRRRRRALSRSERDARTQAFTRRMLGSPIFLRSRHIAFYLPNDGELDLHPLIDRARTMGKRCYLPVLGPVHHNRLWFARFDEATVLSRNRFGIPEPVTAWERTRRPWSIDLMLTPLVAFDGQCNRLGMGGGFYDRTLAYLMHRKVWRRPLLLGVAYDFQQCQRLPRESWDVPLHGIVTDRGFHWPGD